MRQTAKPPVSQLSTQTGKKEASLHIKSNTNEKTNYACEDKYVI